MILFEATYDDGDYYCEGQHLIGVFTTRELAEIAIEANKQREDIYRPYPYDYTISEIEVDKAYE